MRHPLLAGLLVSLLAWMTATGAVASEVDTFHKRLLEDGMELAASGDFGAAAGTLRLACFGMLERPRMLGPCLGHLLAAQAAADAPEDELEVTVDRLLEVELRFKGWSEPEADHAPSPDLRRQVEEQFVRLADAEDLARIPSLADAALRKQAEQVAAMPEAERRKQLNLLVQRQASIPLWHVMSAELSLGVGDFRAAARAGDEILRKFDGHGPARCVRGRARAGLGECDATTIDDLVLCPVAHPQRDEIDEARLRCLVETERWLEAQEVLDRLPAQRQERGEVRKLKRRIDSQRETGGAAGATGSASTHASGSVSSVSSEPPIYAPPPGLDDETADLATLPDEDRELLRQVRDALASERRDLYATLWPALRKVAKRHEDSAIAQRLAGSLAFHLAKWRAAIRFLRRDETLASSRPELHLHLALALHYQGEWAAAKQEFERCREHLVAGAWVDFWARELGVDA